MAGSRYEEISPVVDYKSVWKDIFIKCFRLINKKLFKKMSNYSLLSASSAAFGISKRVKIVLFFVIFTAVMYFYYAKRNINPNNIVSVTDSDLAENVDFFNEKNISSENDENSSIKFNILFWTMFFHNRDWVTGDSDEAGKEILESINCPVTNCFFTHNHTLLSDVTEFDAIAFHTPEYFKKSSMPSSRSPRQLYIMTSLE